MTIQTNGKTETKETLDLNLCVSCENGLICKFARFAPYAPYAPKNKKIVHCSHYVRGGWKPITFEENER